MKIVDWNIQEITGYVPKTTFYTDFSIADNFGIKEIRDTYKRAFSSWKNDVEYVTELVMALNWKIWEWYEKDIEVAKVYEELWQKADEWCLKHLKGKELRYFISAVD